MDTIYFLSYIIGYLDGDKRYTELVKEIRDKRDELRREEHEN